MAETLPFRSRRDVELINKWNLVKRLLRARTIAKYGTAPARTGHLKTRDGFHKAVQIQNPPLPILRVPRQPTISPMAVAADVAPTYEDAYREFMFIELVGEVAIYEEI